MVELNFFSAGLPVIAAMIVSYLAVDYMKLREANRLVAWIGFSVAITTIIFVVILPLIS